MARLMKKGRITFLRAHELGTGFGPNSDKIDVEVVVRLDSQPDEAFGFQLRDNAAGPAHRAMFDLLRDGYAQSRTMQFEVDLDSGKKHGLLVRVTMLPAPLKPTFPIGGAVVSPTFVVSPPIT